MLANPNAAVPDEGENKMVNLLCIKAKGCQGETPMGHHLDGTCMKHIRMNTNFAQTGETPNEVFPGHRPGAKEVDSNQEKQSKGIKHYAPAKETTGINKEIQPRRS